MVLKHLLAFRHMGNVTLNRPAEPIANTKVNLDPFSQAHLARIARKCNSLLLPQLWVVGKGWSCPVPTFCCGFLAFPSIKVQTQQCSEPQMSAKGRIPFS